jgi:hypothetical protein
LLGKRVADAAEISAVEQISFAVPEREQQRRPGAATGQVDRQRIDPAKDGGFTPV